MGYPVDGQLPEQGWFNVSDIPRDDATLIRVVEELGDKANGRYSALKIIEIPSDIQWEIGEYDGSEWVAEKHRRWE